MYVRKCPKCSDGKMLAVEMKRGWGKEYHYVCNKCAHDKWIYEGNPTAGGSYENSRVGFWLFLIIIEAIVFFNDDIISGIGFTIYISLLLLFIYNLFKPNKLKLGYEILEWIDLITPEEANEESNLNYSMKDSKIIAFIGVIITSVIAVDYFDNWYLLIFAFFAFVAMYYYGFLDISSHRREKSFKDQKIVKIDPEGKPIL